jgi:thiaminase/transcriptional activator TenA
VSDRFTDELWQGITGIYGAILARPGPGLAPSERERVRRHFRVTSRYEWMFWDMGYHRQSWPL